MTVRARIPTLVCLLGLLGATLYATMWEFFFVLDSGRYHQLYSDIVILPLTDVQYDVVFYGNRDYSAVQSAIVRVALLLPILIAVSPFLRLRCKEIPLLPMILSTAGVLVLNEVNRSYEFGVSGFYLDELVAHAAIWCLLMSVMLWFGTRSRRIPSAVGGKYSTKADDV